MSILDLFPGTRRMRRAAASSCVASIPWARSASFERLTFHGATLKRG